MKVIDLLNVNLDWRDDDEEIEIWSRNGHKLMTATAEEIKNSFFAECRVLLSKSKEKNYIMVDASASSETLGYGEERITGITFNY